MNSWVTYEVTVIAFLVRLKEREGRIEGKGEERGKKARVGRRNKQREGGKFGGRADEKERKRH